MERVLNWNTRFLQCLWQIINRSTICTSDIEPSMNDVIDVAAAMLEKMELENAKARSAAGALTSHPLYFLLLTFQQCFCYWAET